MDSDLSPNTSIRGSDNNSPALRNVEQNRSLPNHTVSDFDKTAAKVSFNETPSNFYYENYPENEIAVTSSEEDVSDQHVHFKNPNYYAGGSAVSLNLLKGKDNLPAFKKRPLNDTPVVSTVTSPTQHATLFPNDWKKSKEDDEEEGGVSSDSSVTRQTRENTAKNKDIPNLDLELDIDGLVRQKQQQQKHDYKLATTLDIPGQTRSKVSPDGTISRRDIASKLVIVMVGLPARGKSYITNKLTRYLNWLQHNCQVFNVGNTRRRDNADMGPESNPLPDSPASGNSGETSPSALEHHETKHKASFFSPDNLLTTALREKWAMDTLDELLTCVIDGDLSVGIFDATNSTKARRKKVLNRILERSNSQLKVLFLESICSDPNIVNENIRLKLSGPDYRDMDPDEALRDFVGRLKNYERGYQTIGEDEEKIKSFSYIKMIDVGKKVVTYNVEGFLASQTVYFLLNFNLAERQIWITRHGESKDNVLGRIGGDAPLTERGIQFSKALARFISYKKQDFRRSQLENFKSRLEIKIKNRESTEEVKPPDDPIFTVWTSMMKRAIGTAEYFPENEFFVKEMRMLDELSAGRCDGMTYAEIQEKYPLEFKLRLENKMTYRYPGVGGESYLDVINRLRPVITEVERTTDHVLIITHRVVSRVLLGYFLNLNKSVIGDLDVPLHTVYCLEPKPYGVEWCLYEYDETTDWFNKVEEDSLSNKKKVEQVNISFKERQYSVVPTTGPSGHYFKDSTNTGNNTNLQPSNYADAAQRARGGGPGASANNSNVLQVDKLSERLAKLQSNRK